MSQDEAVPNPADSFPPVAEPKPGAVDEPRMDYLRVFTYVFDHPNWMMIVLLGAICYFSQNIIPIVGALLFLGYQFEVTEALIRNKGQKFPDFDFNRFSEYLMRGLWPFLVSLIVGLAATVPLGLVASLLACGSALSANIEGVGTLVMLFLMLVGTVAMMAIGVLLMLVAAPMVLRAGLTQEFGEGFKIEWVKDFIRRTWREMVLFAVVMMAGAFVLLALGLLVLCVGAFAAQAIITLAQAHMYYQLYELYLARGGEPIPLDKPEAA